MQLIQTLRSKNVNVIERPAWGTYLRKQWENCFAGHLSLEEKKSIYLFNDDGFCGYLWHVFSYEKQDCLRGKEAEREFNNVSKQACYVFYQHSNKALVLEQADALTADDLREEQDVYVVDHDFSWTYVQTHESQCGPYFCRRS